MLSTHSKYAPSQRTCRAVAPARSAPSGKAKRTSLGIVFGAGLAIAFL